MSDPNLNAIQIATDQLLAVYRDTFVDLTVRMEQLVLDRGGSPELAVAFAMETFVDIKRQTAERENE